MNEYGEDMNEYGEVLERVSLKDYNTYKIGGIAKYIVKPYYLDNLIKLIDYLNDKNIKYFVLGSGSNVILPDEDYDGCIILLSNLRCIGIENNTVTVEAGISLNLLIMSLIDSNLGGLENLYGIPGTLGGAIRGNAGCHGSEISDTIESVTYLENGNINTVTKSECEFSYRNSLFKNSNNKIILSAEFKLSSGNKEEMLEIIKNHQRKRLDSQPLNYPNAGSVFKNPKGEFAGKLIEDLGLKGYHIGDAYISEKHANFIVNKGNATSKDIISLIQYIKNKVNQNYNIELELEQEIIKF